MRGLGGGVITLDIGRGVGLGIAEPLGFGEALVKAHVLLLHPREDVIAGSVQDAVDAADRIAGQALAQRLDDGNAAGDRCFEIEKNARFLCHFGEFDAVLGEKWDSGAREAGHVALGEGGLAREARSPYSEESGGEIL